MPCEDCVGARTQGNDGQDATIVRTWGAAALRPYMIGANAEGVAGRDPRAVQAPPLQRQESVAEILREFD